MSKKPKKTHGCPMDSKSMFPMPCECAPSKDSMTVGQYLRGTRKPQDATTPRPWADDGLAIVGPQEHFEVAVMTVDADTPRHMAEANGELIVRAVNAHDALVAALSHLASICEITRDQMIAAGRDGKAWAHHHKVASDALKLAGEDA